MPGVSLPNNIDVNTTADAVEVEQNFDVLESYVNTDVIRRDGGVAMQNPLLLQAGDPTADNHAANKGYVDALMPVGAMFPYCGTGAPEGAWKLCDGQSLAVASYPLLHGKIGYRYGGSGATFKVPNMKGRVPVGVDSTQPRFNATGKSGGSSLVPIPSHSHTINHDHGGVTPTTSTQSVTHTHAVSGTTSNDGNHYHKGYFKNFLVEPGGGYWLAVRVDDAAGAQDTTMTQSASAHTHTFSDTSAAQSASHTHTVAVNLPALSGVNSGVKVQDVDLLLATGGVLNSTHTETSTEHVAPFAVVNYIIRVDDIG